MDDILEEKLRTDSSLGVFYLEQEVYWMRGVTERDLTASEL